MRHDLADSVAAMLYLYNGTLLDYTCAGWKESRDIELRVHSGGVHVATLRPTNTLNVAPPPPVLSPTPPPPPFVPSCSPCATTDTCCNATEPTPETDDQFVERTAQTYARNHFSAIKAEALGKRIEARTAELIGTPPDATDGGCTNGPTENAAQRIERIAQEVFTKSALPDEIHARLGQLLNERDERRRMFSQRAPKKATRKPRPAPKKPRSKK